MGTVDSIKPDELRSLAEAAAWRVRLREAGVPSSEAFEAWLASDPAHAEAWQASAASWEYLDTHATAIEMIAARRDALERARRVYGGESTRPWRRALIAAGVVLALLAATLVWLQTPVDSFRTAVGERRVVTLEDGSSLTLDSASEVRVRYTWRARDLVLVAGQARFDVTHNPGRPFSVHAREQTIVATGTSFDVALDGANVRVVLIEGHVVVHDNRKRTDSVRAVAPTPVDIEMNQGQKLVLSAAAPAQISAASLEKDTAWESGRIVVDNETLASVVLQMTRYSAKPLIAVDDSIGQWRLSGVFDTNDVDGFVNTVTHYFPIDAVVGQDGAVTLRPRSGP